MGVLFERGIRDVEVDISNSKTEKLPTDTHLLTMTLSKQGSSHTMQEVAAILHIFVSYT